MSSLWLLLIIVPAMAQATTRSSRSKSGTAACPDRAVRVLVIGGELQANSWCDKHVAEVERKAKVEDKKRHEREEYNRAKEEERSRRKELDQRKREAERDRRARELELKRREHEAEKARRREKHDCRGVGYGAGCTEENPGKGRAARKDGKKH